METVIGVLVALIAIALVGYPLFFARPETRSFASDGEIRQEVERYRASIRTKTLCDRCLTANPANSSYCSDCGSPL